MVSRSYITFHKFRSRSAPRSSARQPPPQPAPWQLGAARAMSPRRAEPRGSAGHPPAPAAHAASSGAGNNHRDKPLACPCQCRGGGNGFLGMVFGTTVETSTVYPGLDISCKNSFQRQLSRVHVQLLRQAGKPEPRLSQLTEQGSLPLHPKLPPQPGTRAAPVGHRVLPAAPLPPVAMPAACSQPQPPCQEVSPLCQGRAGAMHGGGSEEAPTRGYTVLAVSALLTRDTCQSLCSLAFMCFSKTLHAQPNSCSYDSSLTGVQAENKDPNQTIL